MNREGIQEDDLPDIIKVLQEYPNLIIEGVLSHFFDADNISDESMNTQIQKFKRMYYTLLDA